MLSMIGSAMRVAGRAATPAAEVGAWQPVEVEYARLLAGHRLTTAH
ncbi:MAG: hypothetical protein M3257_00040 [Actinomycetota bacterium]|nr:hypothetical protein [Actinomycetota bacterium]